MSVPPVTLAEVARAAEVAVGTASRVLNNFTDVSSDARQRVLDAMKRLQYRPLRQRRSAAGVRRSLVATGGGRRIGLVLLGMDNSLVHLPVLSELLHGVESAIGAANGTLLLANVPDTNRVPAILRGARVDGLIVKTSHYGNLPDPQSNALSRSLLRFPIVWIWARPAGAPGDVCTFNHETAGVLAARHLAALGHRRVSFLNPKPGKYSLEYLKRQFHSACAAEGLELQLLESPGSRNQSEPETAVTDPAELGPLIDQWLTLPKARRSTAIFVPADNIAAHLYTTLAARGIAIPRDVGVISCNHEKPLARALQPPLTTLEVHAAEIGRRAVDQLLWRIAHTAESATQTILLEPTLVGGDSLRAI